MAVALLFQDLEDLAIFFQIYIVHRYCKYLKNILLNRKYYDQLSKKYSPKRLYLKKS